MELKNLHIITQNESFFIDSRIMTFSIKCSDFDKIKKTSKNIIFFLYDYNKKKIYGHYNLDLNNIYDIKKEDKKIEFNIKSKRRRGVYYLDDSKVYKDFSVYKIDESTYNSIDFKLSVLNKPITQAFFDVSIRNNIIKYKYIETYPSLCVLEYSKAFDINSYNSIYFEYKKLISIAGSEVNFLNKYLEIGNALANMFIPEKEFRKYLLNSLKLLYLSTNNIKIDIPWNMFAIDNTFLSESIVFSHTYAKNIFYNVKTEKSNMAIVFIPNDDIPNAFNEVEVISQNISRNIDVYSSSLNYFEIINIFENYDIVHIITHGYDNSIFINKDYPLKSIDKLQNPPSLVFLSVCNMELQDNKLISSFLDAGVKTVIAGVGSLSDMLYINFVKYFYDNLFCENSSINTLEAYYFASKEYDNNSSIFLRYKFYGVPSYI